jgi:membrane associated rhomboid family serine protease
MRLALYFGVIMGALYLTVYATTGTVYDLALREIPSYATMVLSLIFHVDGWHLFENMAALLLLMLVAWQVRTDDRQFIVAFVGAAIVCLIPAWLFSISVAGASTAVFGGFGAVIAQVSELGLREEDFLLGAMIVIGLQIVMELALGFQAVSIIKAGFHAIALMCGFVIARASVHVPNLGLLESDS